MPRTLNPLPYLLTKHKYVWLTALTVVLASVSLIAFNRERLAGRPATFAAKVNAISKEQLDTFLKPTPVLTDKKYASAHAQMAVAALGAQQVCFARGNYIYLLDTATNSVRQIAKGTQPSLSPNGREIAYTLEADEPSLDRTIKVLDLGSNQVRDLQSLSSYHSFNPQWSPDGTKLAFNVIVSNELQVGVLDLASNRWFAPTESLKLANQTGLFLDSWSATDRSLICHSLEYLYEVALDGNLLRTLPLEKFADAGDISSSTKFSLSQDKRLLLFDTTGNPDETSAIYVYNLEQQKLSRVTPETVNASEPQWLPSSNGILFTRITTSGRKPVWKISKISLDGRDLVELIPNAHNASYSTR